MNVEAKLAEISLCLWRKSCGYNNKTRGILWRNYDFCNELMSCFMGLLLLNSYSSLQSKELHANYTHSDSDKSLWGTLSVWDTEKLYFKFQVTLWETRTFMHNTLSHHLDVIIQFFPSLHFFCPYGCMFVVSSKCIVSWLHASSWVTCIAQTPLQNTHILSALVLTAEHEEQGMKRVGGVPFNKHNKCHLQFYL